MNLSEATKLVAILKGVYLREQFTDESPQAFLWLLEDLPYDVVLQAAKIHGTRSKWCPTPSELREIIANQAVPAIPAGEAWEVVQKQIRKNGYAGYDQCAFGDEAIDAAVRRVGWRRLCLDEDQKFIRRDFDQALEAAQERIRTDVQSGAVALGGGEIVQLPRKAS